MKTSILWLLLLAIFLLHAESTQSQTQDDQPEKINRLIYGQKSKAWYQKQAELWRQRVFEQPRNAEGWYNLYLATEYAFLGNSTAEKHNRLQEILNEMAHKVPDTFEYYVAASRFDSGEKIELLEKAHKMRPDAVEPLYGLISQAKLAGDEKMATGFLRDLYRSQDIAPGLLEYNYNVLMSTDEGALLLTNGDNDTYPVWVLQTVKNIRPDVTILNIHLARQNDYLNRTLSKVGSAIYRPKTPESAAFLSGLLQQIAAKYPQVPVYLAFTVDREQFRNLQQDLYVTGLAYQYSPAKHLDNLALLKRNLEKHFRLDYLSFAPYSEDFPATTTVATQLNTNYVTPFLMLASHYRVSDETQAADIWRQRARKLAEAADSAQLIDYIEKNY